MHLRTNKKVEYTMTQPTSNQEMRYVSPRQTASDNIAQTPEDIRGEPEPLKAPPPLKNPQKPQGSSEKARDPAPRPSPPIEMRQIRQPPSGGKMNSKAPYMKPSSQRPDAPAQSSKKISKEKRGSVVKKQNTVIDVPQNGENKEVGLPPAHSLADCPSNGAASEPSSKLLSQQHTLASCSTIEVVQRKDSAHPLSECSKVEVTMEEVTPPEHTVETCENAIVASSSAAKKDTTSTTESHDLSYVHDFTDCPVDKSVLEYYEKEEKRSQQHALVDCIRTPLQPNHADQHALIHCAQTGPSSEAKSSSPGQHGLADCYGDTGRQGRRASSPVHSPINKSRVKQHRLVSCPVSSSRQNSETAAMAYDGPGNTRIKNSGDSQVTLKLSHQRTLSDCAVDPRSGGKEGAVEGHIHDEDSSGQALHHDHTKARIDQKKARRRRNSKYRQEAAKAIDYSQMKSTRPADHSAQHALEKVLSGSERKKENSHQSHETDGTKDGGSRAQKTKNSEGAMSVSAVLTEQRTNSSESPEEQKHSGSNIAGMSNRMTSTKGKGQE